MNSPLYHKSRVFCFVSGQNTVQTCNHFSSEMRNNVGRTRLPWMTSTRNLGNEPKPSYFPWNQSWVCFMIMRTNHFFFFNNHTLQTLRSLWNLKMGRLPLMVQVRLFQQLGKCCDTPASSKMAGSRAHLRRPTPVTAGEWDQGLICHTLQGARKLPTWENTCF